MSGEPLSRVIGPRRMKLILFVNGYTLPDAGICQFR
jgi:hypothetical protein